MFGGAAVAGWLALLLLSFALAWLLDQAINTALAFAIVGVLWVVAAFIFLRSGRATLARVRGLPATRHHQGGRRMGQSAEELRREIEGTRNGLADTLDAIGDRVSPGRIVERRKNRVDERVAQRPRPSEGTTTDTGPRHGETAGGAVDTLKSDSRRRGRDRLRAIGAAGAVAFGFGVLLASIFPASAQEEQAAEGLMDQAQPLTDGLEATGQEMAERLKEPPRAVEQAKQVVAEGQQAVDRHRQRGCRHQQADCSRGDRRRALRDEHGQHDGALSATLRQRRTMTAADRDRLGVRC